MILRHTPLRAGYIDPPVRPESLSYLGAGGAGTAARGAAGEQGGAAPGPGGQDLSCGRPGDTADQA